MSKPESYASVWDAIADTPEQAANLRARAELLQKIGARLKKHDWTQAQAASRCGVTQPRINDLLALFLSEAPASRAEFSGPSRALCRITPIRRLTNAGRFPVTNRAGGLTGAFARCPARRKGRTNRPTCELDCEAC